MSDPQDIVARLRAYTQHDRPVLSSDLKNAADYIEQLRRELIAAIEQRNAARADAESTRQDHRELATMIAAALDMKTADLAVFRSDRDLAVEKIKNLYAERECLQLKLSDVRLEAHRGAPNGMHKAKEVVGSIAWDILNPCSPGCAAPGHRPDAAAPPTTTERFDEIERRMALLESSVRLNTHRIQEAARAMSAANVDGASTLTIARMIRLALCSQNVGRDA